MQTTNETTVQHTPGPWIIETDESGLATVTDSATEGIEIAKIRTHSIRIGIKVPDLREEKTANARLIAAAPELLAALEAIRTAYDNAARHGHSIPSEIVRTIAESAKVTAKAKGL